MRKKISQLLALSMLLPMCCGVRAEENKVYALKEEQTALLEALDFQMLDKSLSDTVTRAEFAYLTDQIAYDHTLTKYTYNECFSDVSADTKYNLAISSLYDMGIVRGYSNANFRPEDSITTDEALTMVSRLFNRYTYFDVEEEKNFAWKMKLTNGVDNNSSKELNLYSAMVILLNTLDADLSSVTYYIENTEIPEYDTYLTRTFSIYPLEGVVWDDGKIYDGGVRETLSDSMVIGDKEVVRQTEYQELYGRRICGFAKKDSRDEYTMLSYYRKDKDSLLINSSDIDNASGMYIEYYSDGDYDKIKKVTIPDGIKIVYNGVPVSASDEFTTDMIIPEKGTVELYCNGIGSEYNVLYVNSYEAYVVMGADATEQVINTKNQVSLELENYDYVITDKQGEKLPLTNIWENSIILVARPLKSDLLHIVVSSDSFTDKITSYDKSDREVKTQEKGEFNVSVYFDKYGYDILTGKTYEIFTDPFGEITYVSLVIDANEYNVGYLMSYKEDVDENGDNYYAIKIINSQAAEQIVKLNERVSFFYPDEISSKRIKAEQAAIALDSYKGILRYKLDDYEKITTIEMPYTGDKINEKGDRLCLLCDSSAGSLRFIGYPIYSFGGVVNVNGQTSVWQFPKDREGTENITVSTTIPFDHQTSYTITAYGRNKRTSLADIVVYNPTALYVNPRPMVITDIRHEYDEKLEEAKYTIEGMYNGVAYTYTIDEELLNNPIDMFNKSAKTPLAKGDVIQFAAYKGEIIGYTLVYDADWDSGFFKQKGFISGALSGKYNQSHNMGNPCATRYNVILDSADNKYKINRTLTPLDAADFANGRHCFVGYVYSFEDGIVNITNQDLHSNSYDSTLTMDKDGVVNEKYPFVTNGTYMTVEKTRGSVKAAKTSEGDIKPYTSYGNKCSKVLVCGDGSTLVGVFIMND